MNIAERNFSEKKPGDSLFLSNVVYRRGEKRGAEGVAIIPLLEDTLRHGISLGPSSRNMAERFEPFNKKAVVARIERFLNQLVMLPLDYAFLMVPAPNDALIVDVTSSRVDQAFRTRHRREDRESVVQADALVTDVLGVPLMVKTADCPAVIAYGKAGDGRPLLALMHAGRKETDAQLPSKTIAHCVKKYGADPKQILVGITPGISAKHYSVPAENVGLVSDGVWQGFVRKITSNGEARIHIDITGCVAQQLLNAGIRPQNIQAYGSSVDTYELASQIPLLSFSHRFTQESDQPERNGRMLVVASL